MNKNYNKHIELMIVLFSFFAAITATCSYHKQKAKDYHYVNEDSCGIDSAYIVDSLHQTYDEVKVDKQGNVYHVECN